MDIDRVADTLRSKLNLKFDNSDGVIRIESNRSLDILAQIFEFHKDIITSITVNRANLEDVFYSKTGKKWDGIDE